MKNHRAMTSRSCFGGTRSSCLPRRLFIEYESRIARLELIVADDQVTRAKRRWRNSSRPCPCRAPSPAPLPDARTAGPEATGEIFPVAGSRPRSTEYASSRRPRSRKTNAIDTRRSWSGSGEIGVVCRVARNSSVARPLLQRCATLVPEHARRVRMKSAWLSCLPCELMRTKTSATGCLVDVRPEDKGGERVRLGAWRRLERASDVLLRIRFESVVFSKSRQEFRDHLVVRPRPNLADVVEKRRVPLRGRIRDREKVPSAGRNAMLRRRLA